MVRTPLAMWLLLAAPLLTALLGGPARGAVEHTRDSALHLAFGPVDSVQSRVLFLDAETAEAVERAAGSRLPTRLVRVEIGWREGDIVGYAFFDTHRVRSLPETLLIVVEPQGRLDAVHLVAFHEPPAYEPPERWRGQFAGRRLDRGLSLRGDLAPLAGSTLTATAITAAVRRALAVWEQCLASSPPPVSR